jgi:hypothetical protein
MSKVITYTEPTPYDVRCLACGASKGESCLTRTGNVMTTRVHKTREEMHKAHWRRLFESTQIEPIAVTSNEVYVARERDYDANVKAREARVGGRYWKYRAVRFTTSGHRKSAEILVTDAMLELATLDVQGEVIGELAAMAPISDASQIH